MNASDYQKLLEGLYPGIGNEILEALKYIKSGYADSQPHPAYTYIRNGYLEESDFNYASSTRAIFTLKDGTNIEVLDGHVPRILSAAFTTQSVKPTSPSSPQEKSYSHPLQGTW